MAQVLIRNIDQNTVDRLRERAERNERSLEAELRLVLKEASLSPRAAITEELRKVHAMFQGRTFSDSADLVREDRDR